MIFDTDETMQMAIKLAAAKRRKTMSELVNEVLAEALKAEIAEARRCIRSEKNQGGASVG